MGLDAKCPMYPGEASTFRIKQMRKESRRGRKALGQDVFVSTVLPVTGKGQEMMATVEEIPVTSRGADTLCPGGLRLVYPESSARLAIGLTFRTC